MRRLLSRIGLAAMLGMGVLVYASTAHAQYIQVYSPPVVVAPPVPVVTYYGPATTSYYYAPSISVPTPYVATTTYSYSYYPPTSPYANPPTVTVYSAPATTVAVPGTVTTRTFRGYGIFRPRGVYTQSYYTPGAVVVP